MPTDDYTSTPSTGKLKLKGVKDSKVTKKKLHKSIKDDRPVADVEDNSVVLKKLKEEDRDMEQKEGIKQGKSKEWEDEDVVHDELGVRVKTDAERRYDEQRRKRVRLGPSRCQSTDLVQKDQRSSCYCQTTILTAYGFYS
jgi:FAM32A